jgi:hypothetical protein
LPPFSISKPELRKKTSMKQAENRFYREDGGEMLI